MASRDTSVLLDNIINQITTTNNTAALSYALRNANPKESKKTIFSCALAGGQDPLAVLG
jgi:hypothetical protein